MNAKDRIKSLVNREISRRRKGRPRSECLKEIEEDLKGAGLKNAKYKGKIE